MSCRWERCVDGGYTFYHTDNMSAILRVAADHVREVMLSYPERTLDFNFDLGDVSSLSLKLNGYHVNTEGKIYGASFEDEDIDLLIRCLLVTCLDRKELPVDEVVKWFPCEFIAKPDEKQEALRKKISELESKLKELKGKLK